MILFLILLVVFVIIYIAVGYWVQWSTQSDFKGIIIWWLPLLSIMWLVRKKWIPFGCVSCNEQLSTA
ncbi:hypothetical protein COPG_00096 [Colwellia phage 9A]|uniref:Uncharacterized protein n=1 Tax=Colwellia phage 9A TaxID=765765 RepID=I3UMH7_9CAUD|nr:hypothetical protein COPG_00096 [Colwellia phage 9A]AFK66692.1 hypothetical protein COPG_00096 [Colwellia phage 9A]